MVLGGGIASTLGASCLLPILSSQKDPRQNGLHCFTELDIRKKVTSLICLHHPLVMGLPLQQWLQKEVLYML